jgi:hypothetical protein
MHRASMMTLPRVAVTPSGESIFRATGVVAWVIGAIALWPSAAGRRLRDGLVGFHWSVLAVAITTAGLVAFRPE